MASRKVNFRHKSLTPEFVEARRDEVFKMAQIGCTDKEMSHILSCSEDVLFNNFATELQEARSHLRRALRKAQLESAINEKNTTMLIWLGKNYLGQKEPKHDITHTGGITFEKVIFGSAEKVIDISESA